MSDPRVKEFIRWTKTLKDGAVLDKTLVGGHYCYPPAPPVFTQPLHNGSGEGKLLEGVDPSGRSRPFWKGLGSSGTDKDLLERLEPSGRD